MLLRYHGVIYRTLIHSTNERCFVVFSRQDSFVGCWLAIVIQERGGCCSKRSRWWGSRQSISALGIGVLSYCYSNGNNDDLKIGIDFCFDFLSVVVFHAKGGVIAFLLLFLLSL